MKGFRRPGDELEARLRARRAEPRPEFLSTLTVRLEREQGANRLRIAFAVALTIAGLGIFSAFGGIGYAASATHSFVSAITSPGNGNGNGNGNAGDRAAPNSDGQASTAQGTTTGGQSTIAPPANPTVQSNANASTQNNGNGNNGNGNNGNDNNGNGNHGNGNNGNGNNGNGNAGNGNNGNGNDDESSADNQYKHKTTICHRTGSSKNPWVIITVSDNALPAHKAHGDTLVGPGGTCPGPPIP